MPALIFGALCGLAVVIFVVITTVRGGRGPAPSAYQQCVTSIEQQNTSAQVIGYTPQCLRLTADERNAAIRQVTSQRAASPGG